MDFKIKCHVDKGLRNPGPDQECFDGKIHPDLTFNSDVDPDPNFA